MIYSIWLNAWDVAGRDPEAMLDELEQLGIQECRLGLVYHGVRVLLPNSSERVVYEQEAGAVYFEADLARFARLRPRVSNLASATCNFLRVAAKRRFPVQAWTVLCHNDSLGEPHPDCTVQNAFAERYSYALCPSHGLVAEYILELCSQISKLEGVVALDLEALSFLGYEHNSLHDKRGVELPNEISWLLSICFCESCRNHLPDALIVRQLVCGYFNTGVVPDIDPGLRAEVRGLRRRVLTGLLADLRPLPINLRFTPDIDATGGKSALCWADLSGLVDTATLTFFNAQTSAIKQAVSGIPNSPPIPLQCGIVFHAPDCRRYEDLALRLQLLVGAPISGIGFYNYGLAARWHFDWLRRALRESAA